MAAFTLFPLGDGIRLSFTNYSLLRDSWEYTGVENYLRMITDDIFWISLYHSIIITTVAVILQLVLGLIVAHALKQDLPGVQLMRSIIMASWVIPVVGTVVMFRFMSQPDYGFINIMFRTLGLEHLNSYWFGNIDAALPMIIIMHLWRNVPFYAIAFMAAMQAIPQDQYDAAKIDGAGTWKVFTNVTLPGIRGMVIVMVTIHVLWTFNNFDFVYIATGGGPVNATDILPVYVYRLTWSNYTVGYGASVGAVMLVILMIYFVVYLNIYERKTR
jgi:ABC-type sugar transport system permease subunit